MASLKPAGPAPTNQQALLLGRWGHGQRAGEAEVDLRPSFRRVSWHDAPLSSNRRPSETLPGQILGDPPSPVPSCDRGPFRAHLCALHETLTPLAQEARGPRPCRSPRHTRAVSCLRTEGCSCKPVCLPHTNASMARCTPSAKWCSSELLSNRVPSRCKSLTRRIQMDAIAVLHPGRLWRDLESAIGLCRRIPTTCAPLAQRPPTFRWLASSSVKNSAV